MNFKKYFFIFTTLFVFLLVFQVCAQNYNVVLDGGRLMWKIEPANYTNGTKAHIERANAIYPGDFRRDNSSLNLIHAVQRMFITTYDDPEGHPWVVDKSGVYNFTPSGAEADQQKKYMRYAYPVITVDGLDAGLYQDPAFIIDPNLKCEMMGKNRSRSICGLTWYTTTYTWSHPDYQDIVINHQQIVNDGYWVKHWEPVQYDTLQSNPWHAIWIRLHRRYVPGYHSEAFQHLNEQGVLESGLLEVNWNYWGYGVQDSVSDPTKLLMYEWNPDNKNENSPLDDEGAWHSGEERFYVPYYFGQGYLYADGPLVDNPNITSPVYWWGIETWPETLENSNPAIFAAFLQSRHRFGADPGYWSPQGGYGNPHYRDPDGDTEFPYLAHGADDAKMAYYFGPFNVDVGDTINIWMAHVAGGIEPNESFTLGKEWAEKYRDDLPAGWTEEDIAAKNKILRDAGISDMVNNYEKAREIFANDMHLPASTHLNPIPPSQITITSGPGYVEIDWAEVAAAKKYNIYRGEGSIESVLYDRLDTVQEGTTSYIDSTAKRNFTYYYYVTTEDEGGLESSQYVVRPLYGASPTSALGKTLDDVRVVPNPFVINRENYGAGSEDQITFAGLPGPCKITIFTLTGDIVDEINHVDNAGSVSWNSRTKYNQYIASGIYIYHVKSTEGKGSKTGKFIVIR